MDSCAAQTVACSSACCLPALPLGVAAVVIGDMAAGALFEVLQAVRSPTDGGSAAPTTLRGCVR
jgi:hypothetical protein